MKQCLYQREPEQFGFFWFYILPDQYQIQRKSVALKRKDSLNIKRISHGYTRGLT